MPRLLRDLALACGVMAIGALVVAPGRPRIALGVAGGGVLVALAYWAIAGLVEQVTRAGENGEKRPVSRAFLLVKFFTRHAILALAAYGMMVRLHLDPIGMFLGVTSVVAAAALTALRRE